MIHTPNGLDVNIEGEIHIKFLAQCLKSPEEHWTLVQVKTSQHSASSDYFQ